MTFTYSNIIFMESDFVLLISIIEIKKNEIDSNCMYMRC